MKKHLFFDLKHAVIIFFTSFFALSLVVALVYIIQIRNLQSEIINEQKNSLADKEIKLNNSISQVGIDVLTVKNMISIIEEETTEDLLNDSEYDAKVEDLILGWLKLKTGYDQMRIIDLSGNEVLRINQGSLGENPYSVDKSLLQNKSNASYFKSMKELGNNEINVSDFNLNVENEEIEIRDGTVVPTFRVMTPLYSNKNGVDIKFGYVVINVLTNRITNDLLDSNIELINNDNYYIYSDDSSVNTYTFLNGREDLTNGTFSSTDIGSLTNLSDEITSFSNVIVYRKITSSEVNGVMQVLASPNIKINNKDVIITLISKYDFDSNETYKNIKYWIVFFEIIIFTISLFITKVFDNRSKNRKKILVDLEYIANTDELTKISNRKKCFFDLNKRYEEKKEFTLLFCDLDEFKNINDTYGHEIGDATLIEITNRIKNVLNSLSTLYRIGGDEFLIITEETNNSNLEILANEIIRVCNLPIIIGDIQTSLGISIGISILDNRSKTIDILVEEADTAMYETKKRSRNSYSFYK